MPPLLAKLRLPLSLGVAVRARSRHQLRTQPPPSYPDSYMLASPTTAYAVRLRPGDDLVPALLAAASGHGLAAAAVVTCVGSLSEARLRLAGAKDFLSLVEDLEIVSLVGTLGSGGGFHLHAALSRTDGSVVGGHIKGRAIVATTAEVVLAGLPALTFAREPDAATGYDELVIRSRTAARPAEVAEAAAPG